MFGSLDEVNDCQLKAVCQKSSISSLDSCFATRNCFSWFCSEVGLSVLPNLPFSEGREKDNQ